MTEKLPIRWRSTICHTYLPNTSKMILMSDDIHPNSYIPKKFTSDGLDLSPNLNWRNIPIKAQSLAIIMDDPDAIAVTGSVYTHFAVVNIPANLLYFKQGQDFKEIAGIKVLLNDSGYYGWSGPAPPINDYPHNYRFTLYALKNPINISCEQKLTVEIFERSYHLDILSRSSFNAKYRPK